MNEELGVVESTTSRFASRKFLLALFAMLSSTGLVYTGHIADGVYSAVMLGTIAAYIAGNVTQKATEK